MRISKMVCGVLAAVVAMAATLSSATAGECPLSKKAVKVQAVKLAETKDIVDTAVGAKSFTTLVAVSCSHNFPLPSRSRWARFRSPFL